MISASVDKWQYEAAAAALGGLGGITISAEVLVVSVVDIAPAYRAEDLAPCEVRGSKRKVYGGGVYTVEAYRR
eukprot:4604087-Pyramimonas_sp.AAC.1